MGKIYDDFVKKNPYLFKTSSLDLFVRVGFLSQDVYVNAKSTIEAHLSELKAKEEESKSASASYEQVQSSTANSFVVNGDLSSSNVKSGETAEASVQSTTTIV